MPVYATRFHIRRLNHATGTMTQTHASATQPRSSSIPDSLYLLRPGTRLVLDAAGLGKRIPTRYIGQDRGRCFIVHMPPSATHPDVYDHTYTGNTVVVRYIKDGNVWGFVTAVQGRIAKPQRLLFLDFPTSVESHNLRQRHRVECSFPASVWLRGELMDTVITDISTGGCRISLTGSDHAVDINDEVGIESAIFLATGPGNLLTGCVRRISRSAAGTDIGIRFADVPEHVMEHIDAYVERVSELLTP